MSENTNEQNQPKQQTGAASGEQTGATEQPKPADGKGGKDAVLADLARERDKRQTLEQTVAQMQQAQKDQMSALAKAFGIEPEKAAEQTGVDALTEQVKSIQEQLATSQRQAALLQVASNPGTDDAGNKLPAIPPEYHHLLENVPTDKLAETAKSIAGLVAATAAQQQTPGFAQSAGQGNNSGAPASLEAQIAAAEKELLGKTPGTADYKVAQRRLMGLKSKQLAALRPN